MDDKLKKENDVDAVNVTNQINNSDRKSIIELAEVKQVNEGGEEENKADDDQDKTKIDEKDKDKDQEQQQEKEQKKSKKKINSPEVAS